MANSYFNYTSPVQPGDRIESNKYNGDFGAIARAFDTLPSPDELATNTSNYAVSVGTATAYQVNLPSFDPTFGYLEGMQVIMKAHVTNTGSATISINGATPVIIRNVLTGTAPNYLLVAGDIAAGAIYSLRYDGTQFQVANTVANALISSQTAATAATNAANAAASSASSAQTSRQAAETAAGNANASANSAANSAATATNAASAASSSAGNASTSATTATNAASAASTSAGTATTQASNAATAATTATNAQTAASNSAVAAANSASAASASAVAAANFAAQAQAVLTSTAFNNAVIAQLLAPTGSLRVGAVKFFSQNLDPNTLYPGSSWTRLPPDLAIRTSLSDGSDVMTTSGNDNVSLSSANIPSHSHNGTVTINPYNYGQITTELFSYGQVTSTEYDFGTVNMNSFNYGTITSSSGGSGTVITSQDGDHTHSIGVQNAGTGSTGFILGQTTAAVGTQISSNVGGLHQHTATFPSHTHSITIPSHTHTVNLGGHTHTINLGTHTHVATVGQHTHTVAVTINAAGSGTQFSVRNRCVKLVGWRRIS